MKQKRTILVIDLNKDGSLTATTETGKGFDSINYGHLKSMMKWINHCIAQSEKRDFDTIDKNMFEMTEKSNSWHRDYHVKDSFDESLNAGVSFEKKIFDRSISEELPDGYVKVDGKITHPLLDNSNRPAYPIEDDKRINSVLTGMTKRETVAMHVFCKLLEKSDYNWHDAAEASVAATRYFFQVLKEA